MIESCFYSISNVGAQIRDYTSILQADMQILGLEIPSQLLPNKQKEALNFLLIGGTQLSVKQSIIASVESQSH
jgi:hypothetical protein